MSTMRESDLAKLRTLLDSGELRASEEEAFSHILDYLDAEDRRFNDLSQKQRKWVDERLTELGLDQDPAERNRNVPVGRPVETPAVPQKLPLKPPGRRSSK